jgi:hypothetical protein
MGNDIPTGFQPGRGRISALVLTAVALVAATWVWGVAAQERRPRPKVIVVQDGPKPYLTESHGGVPVAGNSLPDAKVPGIAFERSLKTPIKSEDSPSGKMLARERPKELEPVSPRIPPLPEVPNFPAVDRPPPIPITQSPLRKAGWTASGSQPEAASERNTLSKRRTPEDRRAGSEPGRLPLADSASRNGTLQEPFVGPGADALRSLPLQPTASVEGRRKEELANQVKAEAVGPDVPPMIFVAGRKRDASSGHAAAPMASAVQPASFTTSDIAESRMGGGPLVVVESAASPPGYSRATGENVPAWQIVGLSVAISFLLALTFLAFSLLLLTMRQPSGVTPGSVIRFELAQAAGGNFVLPFPLVPQTSPMVPPASQPVGTETASRGPTRVADFAGDVLGGGFGPILGQPRTERDKKTNEREASILQQIFEDNVTLQKRGA